MGVLNQLVKCLCFLFNVVSSSSEADDFSASVPGMSVTVQSILSHKVENNGSSQGIMNFKSEQIYPRTLYAESYLGKTLHLAIDFYYSRLNVLAVQKDLYIPQKT